MCSGPLLCVVAKVTGLVVQVDADDMDDADEVASKGGSGDEVGAAVSRAAARKKTRVDRNRERRRRDAEVRDTVCQIIKACSGLCFHDQVLHCLMPDHGKSRNIKRIMSSWSGARVCV